MRMFLTKGWLALVASGVFGLALASVGCADTDINEGSVGGSKGPEMITTMANGRQISGSASSMNQSTAPSGAFAPPTVDSCAPDVACLGGGCMGVCDPARAVITACARCENGVFTDCTERACTPQ